MYDQHLACPNCQNNILFDVHVLLRGESFTCTECNARIGLPAESHEVVAKSMEELAKIKGNALKSQL